MNDFCISVTHLSGAHPNLNESKCVWYKCVSQLNFTLTIAHRKNNIITRTPAQSS